jgi:hypothetical protein
LSAFQQQNLLGNPLIREMPRKPLALAVESVKRAIYALKKEALKRKEKK